VCVIRSHITIAVLAVAALSARSQTVPIFQYRAKGAVYSIIGRDPARGGTTGIPVIVVSIALRFASHGGEVLGATGSIPELLHSPVFAPFPFPGQETTQYADAMLRTSFQRPDDVQGIRGHVEAAALPLPTFSSNRRIRTAKITSRTRNHS
jgi:chitinase